MVGITTVYFEIILTVSPLQTINHGSNIKNDIYDYTYIIFATVNRMFLYEMKQLFCFSNCDNVP